MNFGEALKILKQGDCVRLKHWKQGKFIVLGNNDELYSKSSDGFNQIEWMNVNNILSIEWEIYREY